MGAPRRKTIVVLARAATGRKAQAVARWVRALVPAAVLVVAPAGASRFVGREDGDGIVLDADALPSGPLSVADAILRAAGAHSNDRER